jgi:hypothetical protein
MKAALGVRFFAGAAALSAAAVFAGAFFAVAMLGFSFFGHQSSPEKSCFPTGQPMLLGKKPVSKGEKAFFASICSKGRPAWRSAHPLLDKILTNPCFEQRCGGPPCPAAGVGGASPRVLKSLA